MPNTHVPAAGEAMPAANVNRRGLLIGAIASVPAIGGAGSAIASPAAEAPDERAVRLAKELSEAMNDFMTPAGDKPFWVAHIKPSSYPNPISFSQHAAPTFTEKVENVRRAAEALKRAMTDLHGVPCKISVADSSDCFIVMTVKAVRS